MILKSTLLLCATTAALLFTPAAQDGEPDRPRILVTNDDGIDAPGLRALVKELATFADVVVCAPDVNKSGASHSLTYFTHAKLVREVEVEGARAAYAIDGTPADTAHFGLIHVGKDDGFDLLISGINHGANVGDLSHGSGTVGAAMEGAFRGVPSMAVSMDGRDAAGAAGIARRFAQQWLARGTDAGVVYSINIPRKGPDGWKGMRAAPMGGSYLGMPAYHEVERTDEGVTYRPRLTRNRDFPEGSDSAAFHAGYVTITPLRFDWTHREALEGLGEWDLEL